MSPDIFQGELNGKSGVYFNAWWVKTWKLYTDVYTGHLNKQEEIICKN